MQNIERAINVLPAEGWDAAGVSGRPLRLSDLAAIVALGTSDAEFVWERSLKNRRYFEELLQFRLRHYERFGFGVHGVWAAGELIGQFGLQVLDEQADMVEMTVFLGAKHRGKGLGRQLSQWLVERCADCGMSKVFGVVRPDNPQGTSLMKRLGWEECGTKRHYGHMATVFMKSLSKGEI